MNQQGHNHSCPAHGSHGAHGGHGGHGHGMGGMPGMPMGFGGQQQDESPE